MDFKKDPKLREDGEFLGWLKESYKLFSGNYRGLAKIASFGINTESWITMV